MSTVQIVTSTVGIQGPPGIGTFVSISGTSYLLGEADRSKVFRFSNASGITVTVPLGLSSSFDCMLVQTGAGQVTVSGVSGVTINAALSATKTAYQYAVATLVPIDTDVFILSGEVTA
jgi:hypothetical protein